MRAGLAVQRPLCDSLHAGCLLLDGWDNRVRRKTAHALRCSLLPRSSHDDRVFTMPSDDTFIIRAALNGRRSTYRDIEIEASKSLYRLAAAIVSAFGFQFDHAFGFYSGLTDAAMFDARPRYELFADMGEADPGVLGVKKIKVAHAFPAIGHALLFLFDYGDEWRFRVTLSKTAKKSAKARYPRVIATRGTAPEQYPEPDESDEDLPVYSINLATGEKIKVRG